MGTKWQDNFDAWVVSYGVDPGQWQRRSVNGRAGLKLVYES